MKFDFIAAENASESYEVEFMCRMLDVSSSGYYASRSRRCTERQKEDLELVPLIHADAERAPLASGRFDLAISEYGASIWCDPYRWVPEAARLLRPGGRLVFLRNSTILTLCMPDVGAADDRLLRPLRGLHRMSWESDPGVEFQPGHGEWFRILRGAGFDVENLIEVYAPDGAETRYDFVTAEWAQKWPAEEVWFARKRG